MRVDRRRFNVNVKHKVPGKRPKALMHFSKYQWARMAPAREIVRKHTRSMHWDRLSHMPNSYWVQRSWVIARRNTECFRCSSFTWCVRTMIVAIVVCLIHSRFCRAKNWMRKFMTKARYSTELKATTHSFFDRNIAINRSLFREATVANVLFYNISLFSLFRPFSLLLMVVLGVRLISISVHTKPTLNITHDFAYLHAREKKNHLSPAS